MVEDTRMSKIEVKMAKFEVELGNISKAVDGMNDKLDNLSTAVIGDGNQNRGIVSRLQTLEEIVIAKKEEKTVKDSFFKWVIGIVISILSLTLGYIAFFK